MILTGILDLPLREDDFYDTLYENAAKLQQAGVRFCISSGNSGPNVRNLRSMREWQLPLACRKQKP